eukprot:TRINITY_DN5054_c0_g1_i11.p1 TRINITY_DN5054_c0_g1~~TRINITY_DN5054_c0_g1_i11.p1  ORF type:complete len:201 (-),score=-16.62 TRINITY_DN5054_c0_g1_i11:702-1304(-)
MHTYTQLHKIFSTFKLQAKQPFKRTSDKKTTDRESIKLFRKYYQQNFKLKITSQLPSFTPNNQLICTRCGNELIQTIMVQTCTMYKFRFPPNYTFYPCFKNTNILHTKNEPNTPNVNFEHENIKTSRQYHDLFRTTFHTTLLGVEGKYQILTQLSQDFHATDKNYVFLTNQIRHKIKKVIKQEKKQIYQSPIKKFLRYLL